MPRPKRPKMVHTAQTALRVAKPVITSTAQKQQSQSSSASSGRVTTGSDDSDGLVMTTRIGEKHDGISQEYTMTGALAPEDIGSTRLRRPSGQAREKLSKLTRDLDHAKALEKARTIRGRPTRQGTEHVQIPSSMAAQAVTRDRQPRSTIEVSALRGSSRPSLASKDQQTPNVPSSALGMTAFKKRPRQPSLLRMVTPQNDSLDYSQDEDLDDFRPDDESTPLIKSLSQSNARITSSFSRQTSSSRKRKLASPEIQVAASQSHSLPTSLLSTTPSQPLQREDPFNISPGEEEEGGEDAEPTLPRPRSSRTPSLEIFSDTLASPQSSSSTPHKPKPRATQGTGSKPGPKPKSGTRSQRNQLSPDPTPTSPTTTTASPAPKLRPPPKPLTTANLQNLLPRRRARAKPKGAYDIPSSSDIELDNTALGEDEDELSFHAAAKMRRKRPAPSMQKRGGAKGREYPSVMALKGKQVSRTYTRKSIVESEAENRSDSGGGEDGDTSLDVAVRSKAKPALDGRAKAEMKRLAEKFKEVDEYTLDFEDMTASSSQMRDAR